MVIWSILFLSSLKYPIPNYKILFYENAITINKRGLSCTLGFFFDSRPLTDASDFFRIIVASDLGF